MIIRLLAILLLFASPALAGFGMQIIQGKGIASTGEPATGTLLVGDNTDLSATWTTAAGITKMSCTLFTASTSGTAHTGKYWVGTWDGNTAEIVVYNSDFSTRLSESDQVAISTDGVKTFTLSSAVTIVASTQYNLCAFANAPLRYGRSGTGTQPRESTAVVWADAPSSATMGTDGSFASVEIWLEQ